MPNFGKRLISMFFYVVINFFPQSGPFGPVHWIFQKLKTKHYASLNITIYVILATYLLHAFIDLWYFRQSPTFETTYLGILILYICMRIAKNIYNKTLSLEWRRRISNNFSKIRPFLIKLIVTSGSRDRFFFLTLSSILTHQKIWPK